MRRTFPKKNPLLWFRGPEAKQTHRHSFIRRSQSLPVTPPLSLSLSRLLLYKYHVNVLSSSEYTEERSEPSRRVYFCSSGFTLGFRSRLFALSDAERWLDTRFCSSLGQMDDVENILSFIFSPQVIKINYWTASRRWRSFIINNKRKFGRQIESGFSQITKKI